ncbi:MULTISPECIES: FdhF/YdeP family oxidoreductase [unclassified Variovorax]|uniref:FdhF/YdeP family oxidoreductase n=1 Tax=unclassified Variovorax TaxID=663243 RepID=UPI0008B177CD|nr:MULTISPECIES: FdhF/YdeP family oxidoreductase [unclassified Variovorax]SEK17126.1 oxidoreductase alpha (molybdopterin) subunit [Variovorax sp. OK202]SFE72962.1 oxidoreductase alpha (molybdopterin) subunit [Variovorax sp. OK212]
MTDKTRFEPYTHAAGGWGSLKAVSSYLLRERIPIAGAEALYRQNKPGGFACVSCAWAKPEHPHPAEFCENGAKATAWELTAKRRPASFFLEHTVTSLRAWDDHELEAGGRLTVPMKWDAESDRYLETSWEEAFAGIGAQLRALQAEDPASVVFYASGRASLESSYMYQLLARLYGNNNLPDSSNMCHESTSVALPETIGVAVGTVRLEDFEQCDAIFIFGQNTGVSSPRMLHQLQDARKRGVPIVTFNPLRERGLVEFVNPQSPTEMLTPAHTQISTQYLQVKNGGDLAALTGLCKALVAADDEAIAEGRARVLDAEFIAGHTDGFEGFAASLRETAWSEIETESGVLRAQLETAAATLANAKAVIGIYGMGLTQHRKGVENVQMVCNLLLLGGHIGRPGAGICPVRGHSNVQGQRTVGITEKPELAPLDKLAEMYGFEPPRAKGLNTVETCEGVLSGQVRAFVGLGGNFVRAVPDTDRLEAAWQGLQLTVHVATKLNRSHLLPGKVSYLLPCRGRIETDLQASGEQTVAMEDSTGVMHASKGVATPAETTVRSEPAIIAGLARASLLPKPRVPWDDWVADYALVRDHIAQTFPEIFHDFNERLKAPGGFPRPLPARERVWKTPNGKANFKGYGRLHADPDTPETGPDVLRLMTLRSDDQFNTTIYSLDDRFRGIHGTRRVLLMNRDDIRRLGFADGDIVDVSTAVDDGHARSVRGLRITPYDIPAGCAGGYYPECNRLVPLAHHAEKSKVPASKAIPIRLQASLAAPAMATAAH